MSENDFTLFCGNLSDQVTEEILYELFLQAGPLEDVRIPTQDGKNRTFGFVIFKHKSSVEYALKILADTKLYGRPLVLQNKSTNQNNSKGRVSNGDYDSLRGGSHKGSNNFSRSDMLPESSRRRGSDSPRIPDDLLPLMAGSPLFPGSRPDLLPRGGFSLDMFSRSSPFSNPYGMYTNPYMNPTIDPRSSRSGREDRASHYDYSRDDYGRRDDRYDDYERSRDRHDDYDRSRDRERDRDRYSDDYRRSRRSSDKNRPRNSRSHSRSRSPYYDRKKSERSRHYRH